MSENLYIITAFRCDENFENTSILTTVETTDLTEAVLSVCKDISDRYNYRPSLEEVKDAYEVCEVVSKLHNNVTLDPNFGYEMEKVIQKKMTKTEEVREMSKLLLKSSDEVKYTYLTSYLLTFSDKLEEPESVLLARVYVDLGPKEGVKSTLFNSKGKLIPVDPFFDNY